MSQSHRFPLLLAAMIGLAGASKAEPASHRKPVEPAIVVWVYNYAPVAEGVLPRAEEEAARVFRKAGVNVSWMACPAGQARDPGCDDPSGPTDIQLRVLPALGDERFGDALGYALPADASAVRERLGGGFGVYATAFYGAVVRRARAAEYVSSAQILGNVIAHEIGHLLLGRNSHTRDGLMSARWSNRDLRGIAADGLSFSRRETRRILDDVEARMHATRRSEAAPEPVLRAGSSPVAAGL